MRNLLAALCFALFAFIGMAHAQTPVLLPSGCGTGNITNAQGYITVNGTAQLCVNAAVSVNGFTPGLTFATLTATGSSASVALPGGAVVAFQNTGTTTVSCTLGVGSATALASEIQVPASSTVFMTVGTNTFGACIDQTGSTSNLVVLAGGTGLGTGFGGGGGGGGGGAITAASGAFAAGALSAGSVASGAMVDLGAQADAVCGSSTGSCSLIALTKFLNNAALAPLPVKAGTLPSTQTPVSTGTTTPAQADLNGNLYANPVSQYPAGAVPLTASATGTTGATTATLAASVSLKTYICSYSVRANATAVTTVANTVTGVVTATLTHEMWVPANTAGLGVDEQIFTPCVPSSAINTAIAVVSGAPGAGGVVSVTATGYQAP